MNILQIIAIALIGVICAVILKEQRPEISLLVAILTGIIILMMISNALYSILNAIRDMLSDLNIDSSYIAAIIKAIAISYLTEFASQTAKDVGQGSIAVKVELAGRVCLLVIAMPIIITMIKTIIQLAGL